jgi:hypothetical protein
MKTLFKWDRKKLINMHSEREREREREREKRGEEREKGYASDNVRKKDREI